MVRLNYALAVARAQSSSVALKIVDELADVLDGYHPFHAARADLLRQEKEFNAASEAYDRAIALTSNALEKRYLTGQKQLCMSHADPNQA